MDYLYPYTTEPDTIIYCWPYSAAAEEDSSTQLKDPISLTVTLFAILWIVIWLYSVHAFGHFFNGWVLWKFVPLLVLPLIAWRKGLTHIRIGMGGITFETASGRARLNQHNIGWYSIKRIYAKVPSNRKNPLAGVLVIEERNGSRHKVPLKKIASAEQWHNLVDALNRFSMSHSLGTHSVAIDLDAALLDSLAVQSSKDPSFTKLWLQALTAPPKRERFQPLSAGARLQNGKYQVQRSLGAGGQGTAYLARETGASSALAVAEHRSESVVLKEYILPVYVDVKVRRQALEDFENEARLLATFAHPGIVRCLDSFVEDHRAYLVLEYIGGKSLRSLVQENGRGLPEAECIRYAISMCEILQYLHRQAPPVVHRDFTPDNLICDFDGSLKLIDFMVAKRDDADSATSTVVGKHRYMPPEQFRGKASPASDIYALGCTVHFLLTAEEPEPMSPSHPILINETVSAELNTIVERATMLDLDKRYATAAEILRDLQKLQLQPDAEG